MQQAKWHSNIGRQYRTVGKYMYVGTGLIMQSSTHYTGETFNSTPNYTITLGIKTEYVQMTIIITVKQ